MPAAHEAASSRLFLALWPDEAVRAQLMEARADLAGRMDGRWIKPENLHLTLAFLGDVEQARIDEVTRIAGETAGAGFHLRLDRAEFWPRNGVVCLSASQIPEPLQALAAELARGLGAAGFPLEARAFRAHLTLARRGRSRDTRLDLPTPVDWPVDAFRLVASRLSPAEADYRCLAAWPLQESEAIPEHGSVG
jgi:2'-5' RNA ligase